MTTEKLQQQIAEKEAELQQLKKEFEKVTLKERFQELLNGCTIKIDREKYPNSIFLFKGDKCFFEFENDNFWISYFNVWEIIEKEFKIDYDKIQALIKSEIEEHFKCDGVTPPTIKLLYPKLIEDHFKCKNEKI